MHLVNPFIITPPTRSWEFIGSTQSETNSITLPASINAGDLLIIFNMAYQEDTYPTAVTPSGFTNKANSTFIRLNNSSRAMVSVKKATGSEDSTSVSTMSVTGLRGTTSLCLQFRPVNFSITNASNITLGNRDTEGYYGNPGSVTASATDVKLPAIAFGHITAHRGTGKPAFSSQSPTFDGIVQLNLSADNYKQTIGYRIQDDVVSSQTCDMSDEGTMNWLQVFQLYDNGL